MAVATTSSPLLAPTLDGVYDLLSKDNRSRFTKTWVAMGLMGTQPITAYLDAISTDIDGWFVGMPVAWLKADSLKNGVKALAKVVELPAVYGAMAGGKQAADELVTKVKARFESGHEEFVRLREERRAALEVRIETEPLRAAAILAEDDDDDADEEDVEEVRLTRGQLQEGARAMRALLVWMEGLCC